MAGGSLFAKCCGMLSRFERGGTGPFYVLVCHTVHPLGVPLVAATYRGTVSRSTRRSPSLFR
jgi:hypothetical protein